MNIVSFGGGTNSTAMIIGMYLHKIPKRSWARLVLGELLQRVRGKQGVRGGAVDL